MTDRMDARVQTLMERCRSIDWRHPRHNPVRAAAAYERWLALLGLRGYVEWVADPADAPAWHTGAPGMVNAWGTLAATDPAGRSVMGLLLDGRAARTPARTAGLSADALIAANWAFVVNLHVATVEGTPDIWSTAWTELAAREPVLALALVLLSPPLLWPVPAPPTVALAAPEALAACADERAWAILAEAAGDAGRNAGEGAASAPACRMPARAELIDAVATVAEPMVEACEAGAFAHALVARKALVLAAPSIWTDGGVLHRADGPAIAWPKTRAGAWKGFLLPEGFVVAPETITPEAIHAVTGRLQHVLIDIYAHTHGHRRCMQDIGGLAVRADRTEPSPYCWSSW